MGADGRDRAHEIDATRKRECKQPNLYFPSKAISFESTRGNHKTLYNRARARRGSSDEGKAVAKRERPIREKV